MIPIIDAQIAPIIEEQLNPQKTFETELATYYIQTHSDTTPITEVIEYPNNTILNIIVLGQFDRYDVPTRLGKPALQASLVNNKDAVVTQFTINPEQVQILKIQMSVEGSMQANLIITSGSNYIQETMFISTVDIIMGSNNNLTVTVD